MGPSVINPFTLEFVNDVMPCVERHYRTLTDRSHRAIAGLSMGGSQTLDIAFRHLAKFAYIGVYSSGASLGRGRGAAAGASSPRDCSNRWTRSAAGGSTSSKTSHNAGRDCTSCHSFTVAGTAYKADGSAYSGAVINVTSGSAGSGTVLTTLASDASGNFYTSASALFGSGVYVNATGTTGAARSMTAAITSGGCNRCHTGTNRLTVD
jgi:hypothetical protein